LDITSKKNKSQKNTPDPLRNEISITIRVKNRFLWCPELVGVNLFCHFM